MAQKYYRAWRGWDRDFPFKLHLPIEVETQASRITLRDPLAAGNYPERLFREHIEKALDYYRNAASQDTSNWLTTNNLGCALLLQGSAYEAVASLQKALQNKPDSPQVLNNLGVAFFLAENPSRSKLHLQEAMKIDPAYDAPLYNLGVISFIEKDELAAKAHWEAYLARDHASDWASRILSNLGRDQQSKAVETSFKEEEEKILGLGIGDAIQALPAGLGTPLRKGTNLGADERIALAVFENGVKVVSLDNKIIRLSASAPFKHRSTQGIRIGSVTKELVSRYGKPSASLPTSCGETWLYSAHGIAFNIQEGRVISWMLFRP